MFISLRPMRMSLRPANAFGFTNLLDSSTEYRFATVLTFIGLLSESIASGLIFAVCLSKESRDLANPLYNVNRTARINELPIDIIGLLDLLIT